MLMQYLNCNLQDYFTDTVRELKLKKKKYIYVATKTYLHLK